METALGFLVTPSGFASNGVRTFQRFKSPRDENEKIYNLVKNDAATASRFFQTASGSVTCTIAGAVVLLLLPVLAKKTYVTENALMRGIIEDVIQVVLL
ncbi:hypothetical protein Tco_0648234 [Tanacetum coccineum]